MTRKEVVQTLRARGRFSASHLSIVCDLVDAIPYRDVVELYLWFTGVKAWKWVDTKGRVSTGQRVWVSAFNLARDLLMLPIVVLGVFLRVRILMRDRQARSSQRYKMDCALFLRTDHWFGLKSGGSVGHIRGVIQGLQAAGYCPFVVSTDELGGIPADDVRIVEPEYGLGRNVPELPELLYTTQLVQWFEKHWTGTASFIYQRYSLGNYSGVLLKRVLGFPFVCEYNGSNAWKALHWGDRRLFLEGLLNRVEALNLHAADLIVAVSDALKNELLAAGVHEERILVNPNGVDVQRYSPDIDSSHVCQGHDLGGKIVVGFIGTFGLWHGAEVLAEAFGRLLNRYPECRKAARLMMIGDGVTMPTVEEIIQKYRMTEVCILPGRVPQDDGPAYLAACDILVCPTVPNPDGTPFFGSPTKLFEYMATGKGILASDLDQIGSILEDRRTALLVKPGDPDDLVRGLHTLIQDELLRAHLGNEARIEAATHYSWEKHVDRTIDRLRVVLDNPSGIHQT